MSAKIITPDRTDLRRIIKETEMSDDERTTFNNCILLSMNVWVGTYDDEIYCVWGVIPPTFLSSRAYVWLYTDSSKVITRQFTFIRKSQIAVKRMLEKYDALYGQADRRNRSTMKWLKWLGAEFELETFPMVNFVIRRH